MRKIAFLISSLVIFCGCNNQKDETRLEQEKLASALPSFYISIEADMLDSIHSSQRVKTYAEATIITSTNDTIYEGDIKIKTRGNSTFFHPTYANKKSYSIKFPINIKVINCEKDNSFNLLANGLDGRQYLSNPFAFELAWSLGLHAPGYTHVHLYTNGTYKGIYQLTNKVNATPQTLSITNLSKANKKINVRNQSSYQHFPDNSEDPNAKRRGVILDENPEDISGGYIIEHCYTGKIPYLKSPSGFISELGETFRIRMPKYASYEEVEYISNFYNQLESAVYSDDGYNVHTGKHYSQYIDTRSFAKYYIMQELFQHCDAGNNSFYMYKDANSIDSLLYAGPMWDFDLYEYKNKDFNNVLYVSAWNRKSGGLFYYLWKHEDFRMLVKDTYIKEAYPIIVNLLASNCLDSLQQTLNVEIPEFKEAVARRSEFLYWLWTSDTTDVINVQIVDYAIDNNFLNQRKMIPIYGNVNEGICLPSFPIINNRDPKITWHLQEEKTPLPPDTIFYSNQKVEVHPQYPSKIEVQYRRVKKKLRRILGITRKPL